MTRSIVVLVALLLGSGCGEAGQTLTLTGSSTVAPLMADIARRFETEHPGVTVDVHSGGSSRGIADLRKGANDIAMISRSLKAGEEDLTGIPLARDGIALIVHTDNPVTRLDEAQVVGIYTGAITSLQDLGGSDEPIVVVSKAAGRATGEVFRGHFGLTLEQVQAGVVVGENAEAIKAVATNPRAIGYVSIGAAETERELGVPIRLLPLGPHEPSTAAVAAGAYPAIRTLYLVVDETPNGLAKELIDFATSTAVHDLVEANLYVPLAR